VNEAKISIKRFQREDGRLPEGPPENIRANPGIQCFSSRTGKDGDGPEERVLVYSAAGPSGIGLAGSPFGRTGSFGTNVA